MNKWKHLLPVAAFLIAGLAYAQTEEEEQVREFEAREAEFAERLREAEKRMAEAAAEIAELTSDRLPQMVELRQSLARLNKPRIGINIESSDASGAVDGVEIKGITPNGPADDAGLRSKDVITAVNGESLAAENSMLANKKLFEFMEAVEEGDELKLDYVRNGNSGSVELNVRVIEDPTFAWVPDIERKVHIERIPGVPHVKPFNFSMQFFGNSFGSMELIELSEGLGKYFGTSEGLLVVKAPSPDSMGFEDGDVILKIGDREPGSVRQALKIFGTYEPGESLDVVVMRDKRQRTIDVKIPDDERSGMLMEFLGAPEPAKPVRAPVPPKAAHDSGST